MVVLSLQVTTTIVLLSLLLLQSVHGWGEFGHEIVANLAWKRLDFDVQQTVTKLLNVTNTTLIEETGSPLAAVANWADRVRHFLPWSAGLHYIDIRDDLIDGGCHYNLTDDGNDGPCNFDYDRDCPLDTCVAGAILNYSTNLYRWDLFHEEENNQQKFHLRQQSSSPSVSQLRESLMFLIQ
jgi:hypothetical protein